MGEPSTEADRYRFLATSVAARPMVVVPTDGPAYTDGSLIAVDITAPAEVVRAQVVLHASLLAAGSLDGALMRRLLSHRTATARYLLLETVRLRDTVLVTQLPGIAKALQGPAAPFSEGPHASLRVALSRQSLSPTPADWGAIRPSRLWRLRSPESEPAEPQGASFVPTEDESEDEPEAPRMSNRLFSAPGFENGVLSQMLRKVFEGRSSSGQSRASGGSASEYSRSNGGSAVGSVTTRLALPPSTESRGADLVAARVVGWYPEWEAANDRYLQEWCRVVELPPTPGLTSEGIPPADYRFRRQLYRTGLCRKPRRQEPAGEDLDLDSLIRYQVDLAAGTDPGDRIWRHHSLTRRDLAVLVLLDTSGSAAEGGARSVLTQHAAAAGATVESLHRLGARVGAVSFAGRGRKLVRITRLKRFHEQDTGMFRARLAAVEPEGFTRLGAAIRHSTTILLREGGATRQLLVVLSDGFPYDDGYEGRHATHDTQRAITESLRAGVGCLCLSWRAEPPAAFEPATSASFQEMNDLEPRIAELFRRALDGADLRRRFAPLV